MIVYIVSDLSPHQSLLPFSHTTRVFLDPAKAVEHYKSLISPGERIMVMLGGVNLAPGQKNMYYAGDTKVELLTLETQ